MEYQRAAPQGGPEIRGATRKGENRLKGSGCSLFHYERKNSYHFKLAG
jgi:hypothetical protein